MKILLTGGDSGGHFYPLIAVAQAIRDSTQKENLLPPELYYMGPEEYDASALFEQDITYIKIRSGKMRRYFSFKNIVDIIKMVWGIGTAFIQVFTLFPDIVFSKGGGSSIPVVLAARFFRIPILIHESDVAPGQANLWAGKFARGIAISFPEAKNAFPSKADIALTGTPVRKELLSVSPSGAEEFLDLELDIPVILVLGGSQGAELINDALLEALPVLVDKYQIIHQTGAIHFDVLQRTAEVILEKNPNKNRYKPFAFLNTLALRMGAGVAQIIISRAGSGAIFEIATWGKASIIIPITKSNGDHQRKNAYAYARTGAALVMEERNLTPHLLLSEIERLMESEVERNKMEEAARSFAHPDAAILIAKKLLGIGLAHETE
jgi:UDP-N-acetylglucosamine--N-acetylmuramyl-(pentapeptide) pyrophosphoryl-undecaprenol N-acetylglucosamine transferase